MSNNKIQKLEINFMKLQTDINYIKESLIKNDNQHKEIISKIDSFVQSADNRFAAKADHRESLNKIDEVIDTLDSKFAPIRAWTIMVWAAKIIGTAIILGLISLIAHAYKIL